MLKVAREKQQITYQGNLIQFPHTGKSHTADLSAETL